ncbi:MAG: 2-oxo acid dehydrogenase subunit E2 [Pirellulales bacterium]|nr:2-oxo acid dehydrogenase subunit E2 [Pirellulales bacterium]
MPNEITIPRLGWSMEEATFIGWLKEPGQWVAAGDVLFTLETDKATEDIEAIDAGTLHLAADAPQPGERVLVGRVIGALLGKGESAPAELSRAVVGAQPVAGSHVVAGLTEPGRAAPGATAGLSSSAVSEASPLSGHSRAPDRPATPAMRRAQRALQKRTERSIPISAASVVANKRPAVTPRARRAARELGVAVDQLAGTGRGGRIRERDVRQAATNGSRHSIDTTSVPTSLPGSGSSAPPVTGSPNIRAAIARRLVAGLHAMAPVTLTTRADATNLVNLRAQFQATAVDDAPVPSLTDVIVKLTALALARHPALNARWQDDRVVENETIAIGFAVDSEVGLFVPVLHDVPSLGLREIAARSRALVERTRLRRLTSTDLEGGTFTVSNIGMLGIDAFTPIINPPQAAVLGVGAIRREPVYQCDGSLSPRELTTLSLTFDHRVVDGAPAARFLQTLVAAIENPAAWLTS